MSGGFSFYEMNIKTTTVRYFEFSPVDTVSSERTLYYRVTDDSVREYYVLSDTTSWLLLDYPLTAGKTWTDVEC